MHTNEHLLDYDIQAEVDKILRVPGIIFAWGTFERVPRIAGTGLEVFEIIGVYKAVGGDWQRLRESFDWLSDEQIQAALEYYRLFPDEVDARLAEEDEALIVQFWKEHPETKPPWR
ncbi:MAG: DUF433 domain-containing protein [Dehalococcoidia bacterium]